MRKRWGALFLAAVWGMQFLTGCGGSAAQDKDIKIMLTLNEIDTFRQTLLDAVEQEASAEGVQLDFMDAHDSIEGQVDFMKQAVSEGYDAIICGPVSADTAVELEASAGDIPIVFCNSCPDEDRLMEKQYIYVGSDEQVAGQYQAEYILDRFPSGDEINVALLKGPKSHSATIGRTKGMKKVLKESGRKINYVFEDNADWDQGVAEQMFEVFLKTGADVDCVVCNNDSMALGIVDACKKAKIDLSSLPILGVDATADGCAAIQNGEMAFSVYQSASGQGQSAIHAAIRLAQGKSVKDMEGATEDGRYVWVPFEKVDSSNVSSYQ